MGTFIMGGAILIEGRGRVLRLHGALWGISLIVMIVGFSLLGFARNLEPNTSTSIETIHVPAGPEWFYVFELGMERGGTVRAEFRDLSGGSVSVRLFEKAAYDSFLSRAVDIPSIASTGGPSGLLTATIPRDGQYFLVFEHGSGFESIEQAVEVNYTFAGLLMGGTATVLTGSGLLLLLGGLASVVAGFVARSRLRRKEKTPPEGPGPTETGEEPGLPLADLIDPAALALHLEDVQKSREAIGAMRCGECGGSYRIEEQALVSKPTGGHADVYRLKCCSCGVEQSIERNLPYFEAAFGLAAKTEPVPGSEGMVERIRGYIRIQNAALYLTDRRIIVARLGGRGAIRAAGLIEELGPVATVLGGRADRRKAEALSQVSPQSLLSAHEKNFAILYADVISVHMHEGLMGRTINILARQTPGQEWAKKGKDTVMFEGTFDAGPIWRLDEVKEEFREAVDLVRSVLPDKLLLTGKRKES